MRKSKTRPQTTGYALAGAVVHFVIDGEALVRWSDGRVNPWALVRL